MLVAFLLTIGLAGRTQAEETQQRYLVVRYDDYAPAGYDPHVSGSLATAKRLFERFEKHKSTLAVGIVPYVGAHAVVPSDSEPGKQFGGGWLLGDDEWVTLLRDYVSRGVVEPALHGFEHHRTSPHNHRPGEFAAQPYDWQLSRIRMGRGALEHCLGTPVRGFIPPWNAWDANTVNALDDLGFQWLSVDLHHCHVKSANVQVFPQCTWDPSQALLWIREGNIPPRAAIVLVTHPFDFENAATGPAYFAALDELLAAVELSPDWSSIGFGELISREPQIGKLANFRRAVNADRLRAATLDTIGGNLLKPSEPIYLSPDNNARQARTWGVIASVILLLSLTAAFVVSRFLLRTFQMPKVVRTLSLLVSIATIVIGVWGAWRIHEAGYRIRGIRLQAIVVLTGAAAGIAASRRQRKSSRRHETGVAGSEVEQESLTAAN